MVNQLKYWGSQEGPRYRCHIRKLDPGNQLFLTVVKLRLSILLWHIGVSCITVRNYMDLLPLSRLKKNWLDAIRWTSCRDFTTRLQAKYVFAIIDGSEIFLRPHLTSSCNRLHVASTSTTIQVNFSLLILLMGQSYISPLQYRSPGS